MSLPLTPASELRKRILAGELSPVELTRACLEQVERLGPAVNAVVTVNERALEEARQAEERVGRGEPGLLCGLPVGIKDVTPVAGLRTTYGSPLFADHVPQEDALVVRRLRAAGAVVLGKTNTPEFAAGAHTVNEVFGATRNPWDLGRSAGGSTGGGAAALATGMVALAEGTDLGGSLRVPAAFCGVVGLRPSPGLVPMHPTGWVWDTLEVSGPMGRTTKDVALLLEAIAGAAPERPLGPHGPGAYRSAVEAPLEPGLRLAYVPDLAGVGVEPEVEAPVRAAAEELREAGAVVEEVHPDLSGAREAFLTLRGLWMVVHHRERLGMLDRLGENLRGNIRSGLDLTSRAIAEAEVTRGRIWHEFRGWFERFDAFLTPCTAVPPFPVEQAYPREIGGRPMESYVDWIAPTFVISLAGLPAISVPCGRDSRGLPVGLQIVARTEERVLGVAAEVERRRPLGPPPLALEGGFSRRS